jgi:ubiquinone/menaquinone biosynthesis C-methylase UbiE
LFDHVELKGSHALIIGPHCESIAVSLTDKYSDVHIITDDYNSVLQYRMKLKAQEKVKIKMMDYAHTDFEDGYFDLVFAQGSMSVPERKNILKEIKRIIDSQGKVCIGEIVSLAEPIPKFVTDIWEQSNLEPISGSAIKAFYESKGFEVLSEKDHSSTMKDFYEKVVIEFSMTSKEEKEQNKKYFSRIKHESNAYIKHGGNKYIGFKSLIMRKSN